MKQWYVFYDILSFSRVITKLRNMLEDQQLWIAEVCIDWCLDKLDAVMVQMRQRDWCRTVSNDGEWGYVLYSLMWDTRQKQRIDVIALVHIIKEQSSRCWMVINGHFGVW